MPAEKSKELLEVLKRARAQLDVFHSDAGHRITTEEIKELQEFLLK